MITLSYNESFRNDTAAGITYAVRYWSSVGCQQTAFHVLLPGQTIIKTQPATSITIIL